jgi:hypothetical protein
VQRIKPLAALTEEIEKAPTAASSDDGIFGVEQAQKRTSIFETSTQRKSPGLRRGLLA